MNEDKKNKKLLEKKREQIHKEMLLNSYISRKEPKIAPKDVCISLKNINKIYPNHVQAVYDFNLDIKEKEFIVFVGPSGCGKSTTLRMIAGLEDITYGDLFIDGKYANELLPKQRDIAMVFQNYALYPNMSVFDNIAFSLKIKRLPKDEIKKRVINAAELLDIKQYLDRKPSALSGGQRQRVALGRAIVRDVRVFLMDEPLSNLDAKLRVQMRSEIVNLHKKIGSTTIYVTHDQTEAMTMADRIVVMKDGYVQQIGTPREIYNNPANLFVATFIGAPAMNILNIKYDHKYLILPDGNKIKTTDEQNSTINNFFISMKNKYEQALLKNKKDIEQRIYELTYPKYEKEMELLRRKTIKISNEIASLKLSLEDAYKLNKEQLVIDEITSIIKDKELLLNNSKTTELEKIKNTNYTPISNEQLEKRKIKDTQYNLLMKEKEEIEDNLEYYNNNVNQKTIDLLFGIRPENLLDERLSSLCKNKTDGIKVKISIAELLGDQYYLHTFIGNNKIISKSTTEQLIQSGDEVKLYIDLDKFHIFDKKSTKRII